MESFERNRQSNLELLRVLAMMCIIVSHYYTHGVSHVLPAPPTQTYEMLRYFAGILAKTSNNVFFLLTGFFLSKATFSLKKLFILLFQVLFVNYLLLGINLIFYHEHDLTMILKQLFPISSDMNWFVSAYLGVYLLGPFLQHATLYLRKNPSAYQVLIFAVFILFGIVGFFTPASPYYSGIGLGIYLVLVGDYVNLKKEAIEKLPLLPILCLCFLLLTCAHFAIIKISGFLPFLLPYSAHFEGNSSPLITCSAVCILFLFSKLRMQSKAINTLAGTTLTVYLIHDNGAFKSHIWFDILKVQDHLDHVFIYMCFSVLVVFFACAIFELIRKTTIEKLYLDFLSTKCDKADSSLRRLLGF